MADLERLYARLPRGLQNVALSAEGLRIHRERIANRGFREKLQQAEARTMWSRDAVLELQARRLRQLLQTAHDTSPFWRRRLGESGVDPQRVEGIDDLRGLPVLTKDEVLAAGASAFGDVPGKTVAAHTSGTTGAGFRFDLTAEAVQEQWAVWWRYRRWHGIEIRTPCGVFAGRSVVPIADRSGPFWRIDAVSRRVLFSAYHLSPQTAPAYVDAVRRRKLPWLHGYPSFIALLAGFVLEQGLDPGPSVRWITTGAENLLPSQADAIEQAFGVRPTQHYGLGEAVANASQCPSGSLHLDEDFAAAELLPRDDGAFQLVGTALANSAMPLIRYDTGDVVADEGSCSCGRPGRVLTRIDGRSEDYVILRDGSLVGRLDHAFKDLMEIREAQIVQSVPGALTVRIVRRPGFSDTDEARLVDELRRRLGNDTEIAVEYVSTLPRSANGKLRFVVSEIARGS